MKKVIISVLVIIAAGVGIYVVRLVQNNEERKEYLEQAKEMQKCATELLEQGDTSQACVLIDSADVIIDKASAL